MNITFLGATKTVTGSNFLVEGAGKKFLVDCGMFQGSTKDELKNAEPFLFDVNEIDFMLLTHAHIDHSGRIPKLYNEGYRNPIFATKATCDLCSIMLPDSGHIQEMEIEWKNRKRKREGKEALPPLYTAEEALKAMEVFKPVKYDEIIEIDPNIHVRFNDAGHMLGSSIIEVWVEEDGKITFLHKVKMGAVDRSYGIHVASLAHLPKSLIDRASEILSVYENKNNKKQPFTQTTLFLQPEEEPTKESKIEEELKQINPLEVTPIEALNILYKLKQELEDKNK